MISLLALLAGFLLDLLIGDPHFLYHPVRLVGALISFLEKVIRKIFPKTEKGELAGGTLMAVLVMAVTTAGGRRRCRRCFSILQASGAFRRDLWWR